MKFTVVILFVAVIYIARAQDTGSSLMKACAKEDIECLRSSTELFLRNTAAGVPQYDIKPIDPLYLDMVSTQRTKDLIFHFNKVTITGLKTLQILNFKMNTTEKSVLFTTKEDPHIVFDLMVQLPNEDNKNFTGQLTVQANGVETEIGYNYKLRTDNTEKGDVEYFEVGPEVITCKPTVEPQISFSSDLEQAINDDTVAKKVWDEYNAHKTEYRKEALCDIIESALRTIIHNLRAVAKIAPKTAFFTNYDSK